MNVTWNDSATVERTSAERIEKKRQAIDVIRKRRKGYEI